ncbi:MAG: uracil-DNA glycosylase [Clostridia bacterium]|nr:uracil-DNA glycosylase [Clostridia bacterium]
MWDWETLENECANCSKCELHKSRMNVVFERGNRNARLMFIGEAPGATEDRVGKAFVGKAGKLLDLALAGLGIGEDEIYICNILKCRPPNNVNPTREQAEMCMGYLKKQIELVSPKAIVLLGGVALKFLLDSESGITRARGSWTEYNDIPVMPAYHPAALLRDGTKRIDMWRDIKQAWTRIKDI